MAVVPADLLDPVGPVQPGLFPDDVEAGGSVLTDRIQGYIDKGVALTTGIVSGTDQDRAVYWYAIYRVWDAVYSMMIARPALIRQDQAETTEYSKEQLLAAKQARDEAYGQYTGIVDVVTSARKEIIPASTSVPTQFTV